MWPFKKKESPKSLSASEQLREAGEEYLKAATKHAYAGLPATSASMLELAEECFEKAHEYEIQERRSKFQLVK